MTLPTNASVEELEVATGPQMVVESSEEIIILLQATSRMTIKELAEALRIGQRAIQKKIEKLKGEDRLQCIGPDNGGHWQVQKVDK